MPRCVLSARASDAGLVAPWHAQGIDLVLTTFSAKIAIPESQNHAPTPRCVRKGVYTISATPFTDAGDIDWPSVDSLVEFYLQCGVQGLTVLGMMGEAQKLSDEESAEFTRHFLRRVNARVPVIVGVSNAGTTNLVKLGRIAMDAGACGVMIAPLTGLKTEAQIVAYFADVIAALGENIPVVYQDYPQSTQADISAQSFLKIVDAHPSVVMFKHEDCPGLKKLTQIRKACDGVARRYISIL